ncbi:hypothetical protein [Streptomyces cadmiisoli]|uniref:hypothetical protein n=1 Tax=Streptomyces cadmiisoli TaxID=2184053 RepID=UPI0013A6CD35|nr:hypothetical protein [Streptomyces cadmiisoli]
MTVRNDDPEPTVTVTPVADRVTEGGALTWRLSLSAVADVPVSAGFAFLPVAGAPNCPPRTSTRSGCRT